MIIGIDISQIVYKGTGVANYVMALVKHLVAADSEHQFVLVGSSLRQRQRFIDFVASLDVDVKKVRLVVLPFPPTFLEFLWNRLKMLPIENFTGRLDIFWSSDWTQPPLRSAIGVTTIHDLTPLKFPETFLPELVAVHKRKLAHSKRICQQFFCDSEATKRDAITLLHIPNEQLSVVYPGYSL